jgi:mono/diheme cytochrome c family protein
MRGKTLPWVLAGLLAICVTPSAPTFGQDHAALEKRGATLLTENCARCHAVGRAGASPHAAAPPFRTLARKYPIESLAEALGQGLSVGHPDMPEFVFEPHDIGAILAHLKSIQER